MKLVALKFSLENETHPLLFTTDIGYIDCLYDENQKDIKGFLNLKKGDTINYPNSTGGYIQYEVEEVRIAYIPNIDPNQFKYGIVRGQVSDLEPYNICIHLILKMLS